MRHESPALQHLGLLKREAHRNFPQVKSAHLSEALAAALGFSSHAAVLVAVTRQPSTPIAVPDAALAHLAFNRRLESLGYPPVHFIDFDQVMRLTSALTTIVKTAVPEPDLAASSDLDRCHSYGIVMRRKPNGDIFATHNVAGAIGPFATLEEAARAACVQWL